MNTVRSLWRLLGKSDQRLFFALITINVLATFAEVLGVFSVLPFLALAGDPALARSQPLLKSFRELCGIQDDMTFVIAAGVVTIIAILLTNIITVSSLWFRTWYCNKVQAELSDRLFRGFLNCPYSFFLERNTAVLGKELLNETQNFYTYALEPITIVIARGLQVMAVALALLIFDWRTVLVASVLFGGFYVGTYFVLLARIHRYGNMRYGANERRFRLAAEALAGIKEVQLFGRQEWYARAFQRQSRDMAVANNRLSVFATTPRFVIEVLIFSALILTVLFKMSSGELFQELAPSLGVFAVAGLRMLPSVQLLFQYSTLLSSSGMAVNQITKLFSDVDMLTCSPSATQPCATPMRFSTNFSVKDVSFYYRLSGRQVLRSVCLDIPAGSCVGICGPSGSGKTTLMDICLGLLQPVSGQVLVDNAPLTRETRSAWQRNVGYVPQSIYLIDGTIAENIAFASDRQSIDMAAVVSAARLAHLHDFIAGTEHGYNTAVGERGVRLSGGQRQRIAIARALYRDPDILFFDEATSALDSDSEALVVEAVQSLAKMKTIVIIAHRLTTLRYCDVIYELREGEIARSGNYADFVPSGPSPAARH